VFTNLIGNALKYNDKPRRHVEIGFLASGEPGDLANAPQECLAETIFYVRDNGIGIERRHFDTIFQLFKRLHGRDEYAGDQVQD
jgi:two-component system, chemotaxis family, sensor kinase Cph1